MCTSETLYWKRLTTDLLIRVRSLRPLWDKVPSTSVQALFLGPFREIGLGANEFPNGAIRVCVCAFVVCVVFRVLLSRASLEGSRQGPLLNRVPQQPWMCMC